MGQCTSAISPSCYPLSLAFQCSLGWWTFCQIQTFLFLLVSVLSHLLVTKKTWMVSGSISKTCRLPFQMSVHRFHHRSKMLLLLSWLKFSQSSVIFEHLLVSTLMRWILVSLGLKMIWVSSGVALIHQQILSYFLMLYVVSFMDIFTISPCILALANWYFDSPLDFLLALCLGYFSLWFVSVWIH